MMKKILCVGSSVDKHLGILDDLIDYSKNVDVCYIDNRYSNGIKGFLSRILLSNKLSHIFPKSIKYRLINISKYDIGRYDIVLFLNGSLLFPYIDKLIGDCKNNKVQCILYLLDSLTSGSPIIKETLHLIKSSLWDLVISFDSNDAQRCAYKFIGYHYYSAHKGVESKEQPLYDIYFTGGLKGGREKLINDMFLSGRQNKVKELFDVMTYRRNDIQCIDGINYRDYWVSYRSVVENVCNSNCILDIRQENQVGPSFRFFEAVCYNKKLLTNNPNIVDFPYYNSRWMCVFDKVEDIDWDWVKERVEIDYHYREDFSPKNLIDYLNNL